MRRVFIAVLALVPFAGMTCEPPLQCANPLDGSDFGFTLTVPTGLDCDASLPSPNEIIRGFVVYRQTGTDAQLVVLVADAANSGNIDVSGTGASAEDCNDIGDYTNANGITFERCMFEGDMGVSYAAFVELPGGTNRLLISLIAPSDDPSYVGILEDTLDGVAF